MLNAEEAYHFSSHDFISAMFEAEGAMGKWGGAPGGPVRGRHLHGVGDAAAAAQ